MSIDPQSSPSKLDAPPAPLPLFRPGPLGSLARLAFRYRGRTVLLWLTAFVVAFGLSTAFAGAFSADYSAPGSDSHAAQDLLTTRFPAAANDTVTLVAHSTEPVTAPGIRARINRTLDQAGAVPHVSGFANPYQEPGAISADGTTIVATLRLETADPLDMPHESAATLIRTAKDASGDGLTVVRGSCGPVSFRSIAVAIKAAVMNLLSVAAAYGVVALVLQGGWAGRLIGIDHPTPLAPFIPVLMFAVLFGLWMDYEVFLVARMRETWLATGSNTQAIVQGLAGTARVITAAAAIMIAVFAAFIPSTDIALKVIGIGMAAAILIDATVIRMLLVPAVMHLLGDKNWWLPAWLDRALPEVHIEGHPKHYRPSIPGNAEQLHAAPQFVSV